MANTTVRQAIVPFRSLPSLRPIALASHWMTLNVSRWNLDVPQMQKEAVKLRCRLDFFALESCSNAKQLGGDIIVEK